MQESFDDLQKAYTSLKDKYDETEELREAMAIQSEKQKLRLRQAQLILNQGGEDVDLQVITTKEDKFETESSQNDWLHVQKSLATSVSDLAAAQACIKKQE